jgi:hypothetical protein
MPIPVAPKLPDFVPTSNGEKPTSMGNIQLSLKEGTFLVLFKDADNRVYDGTLRVTDKDDITAASGDLYLRTLLPTFDLKSLLSAATWHLSGPKPKNGIPALPLASYRQYFKVTALNNGTKVVGNRGTTTGISMSFERWTYDGPKDTGNKPKGGDGAWSTKPNLLSTVLNQIPTSGLSEKDYPSINDCFTGEVTESGRKVGDIKLFWVSPLYRSINLEIFTVTGAPRPETNGSTASPATWQSVFESAGIDLTLIDAGTGFIKSPSGTLWAQKDLHAEARRLRSKVDPTEDRYTLFVVDSIESADRGTMFDWGSIDTNSIPREGAAVATGWKVPGSGWGTAKGKTWGSLPGPLFRTAVHEIGHAMNLPHNLGTRTFMDTSEKIASLGENTPTKFPQNIKYEFHSTDIHRLHHWPDVYVRPGGFEFDNPRELCDSA